MKNKLCLISLLSLVCLSCSYNQQYKINKQTFYDVNNNQSLVNLVDLELVANKTNMAIYLSNKTCSSCENHKVNIDKYIRYSSALIYTVDISYVYELSDILTSFNPFEKEKYQTGIYLIEGGKLKYLISGNKLTNYNLLKENLDSHLKESNLYYLNNYESFINYVAEFNESYVHFYTSASFYKSKENQAYKNEKVPHLFINYYLLSLDDKTSFQTYFQEVDLENYTSYYLK